MNFYLFMILWTTATLAIVTVLAVAADRDSERQHHEAASPDQAGDRR